MKIKSTKSAFLWDDSNRFVCVEPKSRPKNSHQMVAQDIQPINIGDASKVMVYHITDRSRECMAFGFEVKEKNVFPVVTDKQQVCFKVLDVKDKIIFDETFLFQWGEPPITGNCGTLKSVAEPQKYLHVENSGKVSIKEQWGSTFSIQYSQQEQAKAANCNTTLEIYGSDKIQENEMKKSKKVSCKRRCLKQKLRGCPGWVASHKPLRCDDRKDKRMKMSVKS